MVSILLFVSVSLFSQQRQDSLWKVANDKNETVYHKIDALRNILRNDYKNENVAKVRALLLQYLNETDDDTNVALAYTGIGLTYYYQKDFNHALPYYNKALKIYQKLQNRKKLAILYRAIGMLYYDHGYMNRALESFNLSLKSSEKGSYDYCNVLDNIGYIYLNARKYDKAIACFKEAIGYIEKTTEQKGLDGFYESLAAVYLITDPEKAKYYLDHGSKLKAAPTENHVGTAYLLDYSNYYTFKKDYKTAEAYAKKALAVSLADHDWKNTVNANMSLAKVYLAMGQVSKARTFAEKALETGKQNNMFLDLKSVTTLLISIYEKQHPGQEFFEVLKLHTLIADSIKNNTLAEYELRNVFESKIVRDSIQSAEKRKLAAIRYQQEIEKQQIFIWAGILASILLLALAVFIFKLYKIKQRINKTISIENKDLTAQKAAIQNHISELLGVVESARDFVAYSKNELVFSYINNAGKKLLHFEESDENAYAYEQIFDTETLGFILEIAMPESILHGFFSGEVTIRLTDHTSFPVLLNVVCHKDSAGEITQFSMIAREISELKNYQQKITTQNAELQKVNKELDRFVYSTSHDLRAPLISVLGVLEILESEFYPEDADFQLYLSMIRSGLARTDDIIKHILEYSKNSNQSVRISGVNVLATVQKVLERHAAIILKLDIKITLLIDEKQVFYSDAGRFQTIVNNLIDNAIRFQRPEEKNKEIHIGFSFETTLAQLTVSDNGNGIDPDSLPHVFEMFYRGSSISSGSGLGLYIVKQMSDLLHAKIEINTVPGEKTAFKLVFPNLGSDIKFDVSGFEFL